MTRAALVIAVLLLAGGCHWLVSLHAGSVDSGSSAGRREAGWTEGGDGPPGPRAEQGTPSGGPLCRSGFCWERPLPQGSALRGIASRGTDLFFSGAGGTILRRDASGKWFSYDTKINDTMHAIWRTSGDLLLSGGDGVLQLPVDATVWQNSSPAFTSSVSGLWGHDQQLWAACGDGDLYVSTAPYAAWKLQTASGGGDLEGIGGSASADGLTAGLFAVGYKGSVLHSAGLGTWKEVGDSTMTSNLQAVWAASPVEGVVVGDGGTILRCQPSGCVAEKLQAGVTISGDLEAVWGNDGYVLAAGASGHVYRRGAASGSPWFEVAQALSDRTIEAIWGRSAGEVFLAGSGGIVLRYDGNGFTLLAGTLPESGEAADGTSLRDLWSDSTTATAVGDEGLLLRRTGGAWTQEKPPSSFDLLAVWDGIAVGSGGKIVQRGASAWSTMSSPTSKDLRGVWHSGGKGVAVGLGGTILHLAGGKWSLLTSSLSAADLLDVHGSGPTNVVAVGSSGTILRWDGSTWHQEGKGLTSAALNGVFVVDSKLAFAVGNGVMLRYQGGSWGGLAPPGFDESAVLTSVWARGEKSVWLAGEDGRLFHYDGAAVNEVLTGCVDTFTAVAADGASGLYLVGENGNILRGAGLQ